MRTRAHVLDMNPMRSLLFVSAEDEAAVANAPREHDADGYNVSLEGMRSDYDLEESRAVVRNALEGFDDVEAVIAVRLSSTEVNRDLERIVHPNLDAVVTEGLRSPEEVRRLDHVLGYLEETRGIEDRIEILAIPETTEAIRNWHAICTASDRVTAVGGGDAPGGDLHCELMYEWTPGGEESMYLRSREVFESRAAGVEQVIHGIWVEPDDLEGLRARARQSRQLGCTGFMAAHPSHVEPINEIFTPDEEAVAHHRERLERIEAAERAGEGRVTHDGEYVYAKKKRRSEHVLERARQFSGRD